MFFLWAYDLYKPLHVNKTLLNPMHFHYPFLLGCLAAGAPCCLVCVVCVIT